MNESPRLAVRKTYKLFIGGAFPRSESGRSYAVNDAKGDFLANAAKASRKDARDAVVAARKAFPGWSGATWRSFRQRRQSSRNALMITCMFAPDCFP